MGRTTRDKVEPTNKKRTTGTRVCADFMNLPRLPSVILRVALGEGLPLLRQVIEGEDRRDGADWDARAAINALNRIDIEHLFRGVSFLILLRMNAIDRTSIYAGGVLSPDAGFCNHVCHKVLYLPGFERR